MEIFTWMIRNIYCASVSANMPWRNLTFVKLSSSLSETTNGATCMLIMNVLVAANHSNIFQKLATSNSEMVNNAWKGILRYHTKKLRKRWLATSKFFALELLVLPSFKQRHPIATTEVRAAETERVLPECLAPYCLFLGPWNRHALQVAGMFVNHRK